MGIFGNQNKQFNQMQKNSIEMDIKACNQIVNQFQGKMNLDSKLNMGSKFSFTF